MSEQIKCFIATPMYGGMCTGFYTQSLLKLQMGLQGRGIPTAMSFMFNESLITRARNSLVHQFLKTDCTHLLFIDADIRFDAGELLHMFDHDLDVMCGIYPKKEINWHEVEKAVQNGNPTDKLKHFTGSWVVNLVDYVGTVTVRQDTPLEVWAGGTGMMLIKRNVFEKLGEVVPRYHNDVIDLAGNSKINDEIKEFFTTSIEPSTRRLLSEDYHFCKIWRDMGGKIYAAPWMNLGHVGSYIFEGELVKNQEALPEQQPELLPPDAASPDQT